MANTYGSNVWKLDTTGVIWPYATQGPIAIKKLIWHPSAASQSLLVSESDGGIIWEPQASLAAGAAGEQVIEFWDEGRWFDGLTLTTLTAGGVLYVYPE